ncbi:MAG TPA: hypothetical protein VKV24_04465 [Casimicrobiaceae bacterium]|nr:hypothetical protein [Casimicrobiaceae bacterium]
MVYVMVNAGPSDRRFIFQEGTPGEWLRVVDTSLQSPQDIAPAGEEVEVSSADYLVSKRSVAVFIRTR